MADLRFHPVRPAFFLSLTALACALGVPLTAPVAAQEVVVTVTGGHDGLQQVLEGNALSTSVGADPEARPSDFIAAARADYRRLLTGLYAEGYYGGTISIRVDGREASSLAPLDAPAQVGRVEIAVDAGPRFTFGSVALAPVTPETELPEAFASGETARANLVQGAVSAAITGWRDAGHALARVGAEDIRAVHADSRLDVAVTIAPGPQLTYGEVAVSGNEAVRTAPILFIADLRPGRVFSTYELDQAQTRLRRTGAFSSVALVEGDTAGPGDTLPITIQVTEMAPRRLGFGAEISTTEGLALTGYWMHRNLLGGAERFRAEATISGIENAVEGVGSTGGPDIEIELTFGKPGVFNPDTDITAELGIARLDEPDYLVQVITGEVSFLRYVREDLTYRGGIGFLTAREETPWEVRDYTLLTMPLGATLDRRDDPFNARSGYYLDAEVTPFLGAINGDDGGRLMADGRIYRSFGESQRVTLALRGQIGSVWGADLLTAPRDFLFYSGGGGTVRGQPYQDLGIALTRDFGDGPVDFRIGGRSFAGLQAEARIGVTENIGLVAFYDYGTISVDPVPDGEDWHAGAGIGLRYNTAIGPLRLDVAAPASGDDAWDKVQVYIGIGQAF